MCSYTYKFHSCKHVARMYEYTCAHTHSHNALYLIALHSRNHINTCMLRIHPTTRPLFSWLTRIHSLWKVFYYFNGFIYIMSETCWTPNRIFRFELIAAVTSRQSSWNFKLLWYLELRTVIKHNVKKIVW